MPAVWTTPRTWTAGETVTASIGNSAWRDNFMYLKDSPTFDGNVTITGTSTLTGVATLTAAPVLSALTASLPVFTNGSKALASNAMTGTGNVVMSTSPTLVTPNLGTPSAIVLTNATSVPAAQLTGTITSATQDLITRLGTITSGVWNAGAVTSSAGVSGTTGTFSGVVTLGATLTSTYAADTNATYDFKNTDTGASANALIRMYNGSNDSLVIRAYSATHATYPNVVSLDVNRAGGLEIQASHASGVIKFMSGGTLERLRLNTNGVLESQVGFFVTASMGGANTTVANSTGFYMGTWPTTASGANAYVTDGDYIKRSTSSIRWKHDIQPLDRDAALTALAQFHPITYRGKQETDQRRHVGLIAEEVAPFAPLLATYDEGGETGTPNYVTYDRIPAYLIVGWQQHDAAIQQLAARIAALEAR